MKSRKSCRHLSNLFNPLPCPTHYATKNGKNANLRTQAKHRALPLATGLTSPCDLLPPPLQLLWKDTCSLRGLNARSCHESPELCHRDPMQHGVCKGPGKLQLARADAMAG